MKLKVVADAEFISMKVDHNDNCLLSQCVIMRIDLMINSIDFLLRLSQYLLMCFTSDVGSPILQFNCQERNATWSTEVKAIQTIQSFAFDLFGICIWFYSERKRLISCEVCEPNLEDLCVFGLHWAFEIPLDLQKYQDHQVQQDSYQPSLVNPAHTNYNRFSAFS